jgi:hypothetical protein
MTVIEVLGKPALRSHNATWDYARWKLLPSDGVLATAPSNFHQ